VRRALREKNEQFSLSHVQDQAGKKEVQAVFIESCSGPRGEANKQFIPVKGGMSCSGHKALNHPFRGGQFYIIPRIRRSYHPNKKGSQFKRS